MKQLRFGFGILLALTALAQTTSIPQSQVLTLEQALQEAMNNNLSLAAERLNVSVAEARAITAKLRPNPVLTVSGQTLNVLGAEYSPNTPFGPNQLNIHTDIPFERGNKRAERMAVAAEEKTLAELGVREVMRIVISNVQNAFVDVQQTRENLQLAQENLKTLENVVRINEARLNAGDLAQVELDRSRVAALQYRTAVQQAQLQQDLAKIELQQAIGRKQKTTDIQVTQELQRSDVVFSKEDLTRQALIRRPDYLSDQQLQARSRADLRLQLANGKVDYSIGTEFTRQSAWGISANSLGVYFSMPLPIFNRNQGEIARAQREIRLFGARTSALEGAIQTEVDKAFRQVAFSRQLLSNLEKEMLTKAKSVRDTTEYSYRRGEASLVEYLDAQRAFNDAMQSFNDARANYARSLYLLDTVSAATISGS